ncbi:hypothetical Protein YC6258_01321 [Gynuella sunshinyii YC6258]|uniref:Uncharacterized protein n=2 Tax=Gynuella sunshinyii TaxID=1445505 RepID=A0A0C5VSS8_9GAMM|nr:hypothetical Protein YC6258_01321 [Gynuella sunshinyii YC6258]
MVGYVDTDLLIPTIDTIIFIDFVEGDREYWLFQDADAFAGGDANSDLYAIYENQLYSILDIEDLRIKLKGLAHLHPIKGNSTNREIKLTDKNRKIISAQIKRLYKERNPDDSITVTTNYRDKGVSINYEDGSVVIAMFVSCKEEPEEEHEIREIFKQLGLAPKTDYLSQKDRVRILSYSVHKSPEEVSNIIGDIFLRAYKIRDNEKLNTHYRL